MLSLYRIEIKYILTTLVLLGGIVVLDRTQVFNRLNAPIDEFLNLMTGFGFVGFFVVAMIANATLLVNIPYTIPLLTLALSGVSLGQILLMSVASGLGAGIGEFISYGIVKKTLGVNPDLQTSALFKWVNHIVSVHPCLAPLLVLIFAVLPVLPDDMVIIPLAMLRYGIKRLALSILVGKLINNLAIAVVFYHSTSWSAERVSSALRVDLALGISILFVMLILYQVEKARSMRQALTGQRS